MSYLDPEPLPDYYEALGIPPSASQDQVKKAYRKLALKFHPDKIRQTSETYDPVEVNKQFILINEAYKVLENTESRERYEEFRRTGKLPEEQKLSREEYAAYQNLRNIRKRYHDIMLYKEKILELSKIFINSAISLDDLIQVFEKTHWISIDKDTLVYSDFVESQNRLIDSITKIVAPLMLACYNGTWTDDEVFEILRKVKCLQLQVIKYLETINKQIETNGHDFDPNILNETKVQTIRTEINNMAEHPIMNKIASGKFGQNLYPLLQTAALFGPPLIGYSLYWSLFATILVASISVRRNDGDLENFNQFLELFDGAIGVLEITIGINNDDDDGEIMNN
ncbi:1824_t:CDS:2 [Diversispora eburnea]|uniref:1824_t:CDS:1 n=1 Tax=Diversispora eburnea TaxID=1213867 RepID=A0A9N8YS29_9GLOM|nr:1824_t:CDS:2 [Diversispora eburnea]